MRTFFRILSFILSLGCFNLLNAAINMSVQFTANADTELTTTQKGLFSSALNFWGSRISGYQDGTTRNWVLTVDTFSQAAQNGGVVLGSAGGGGFALSNFVAASSYSHGRFIYSTSGVANFNTHPDAGNLGLNSNTIRHEIGHALGIGTLWEANEVYNDGDASNNFSYTVNGSPYERFLNGGTPGQYMGASALTAYRAEYDPDALYIPIELDGGAGTANGHWNEVTDNFGVENQAGFDSDPGDGSAAPIVTAGENAGESLDDELMTGVLSGSAYLSNTTLKSLEDIGFTVVPEPATFALIISLVASLSLRPRKKRAR
jgi:hypothetical protein